MKKILPIFVALLLFGLNTSCDSKDDNHEFNINEADLPRTADAFVKKNFPNTSYRLIKKQKFPDSDGSVYDVTLSNNFEIEFDINGNWIDINGNNQVIPHELIPENIANYVMANYNDKFITSIDFEIDHVEIELSNKVELIFDLQGNFLRIDN